MTEPQREILEGVRLARRATALGTNDAFALCAGGFTLAYLAGELDAGIALTDRALQLNPNLAVAWQASGWIRSYIGEPITAIEHLARAMRLSPLDPQTGQLSLATALAMRCAERYDEAAFWAKKVLQAEPDFLPALLSYAISTALAGRPSDARITMSRVLQIDPSLSISRMKANMLIFRRPEDRSNTIEGARLAGMPE
jgi:adenylate cyclase